MINNNNEQCDKSPEKNILGNILNIRQVMLDVFIARKYEKLEILYRYH